MYTGMLMPLIQTKHTHTAPSSLTHAQPSTLDLIARWPPFLPTQLLPAQDRSIHHPFLMQPIIYPTTHPKTRTGLTQAVSRQAEQTSERGMFLADE